VRKWLFVFLLIFMTALYAHQARAQKESHKGYASMKIAECNDCHKAEGISPNHDADWVKGHSLLANKPVKNCIECHDQAYCLDCHQGGGIDVNLGTQNYQKNYIPKSHVSDWIEIHPIKSLDNPQTCYRCHAPQYCQQCHSKYKPSDLQNYSHRKQFTNIQLQAIGPNHANFTPSQCATCHRNINSQLVFSENQWRSDHAVEARRNLQGCQSCHSDGDVCMKCHSSRSGLKVNPHPRNWNAIKGNFKSKSNGKSCIKCHDNY